MENSQTNTGNRKKIIPVLVIVAFAAFAVFNFANTGKADNIDNKKSEAIPVSISTAVIKPVITSISLSGNIKPRLEVFVTPMVPGRIIRDIFVDRGDFVKKGQLLASIDNAAINARIDEAKAGLRSAKAAVKQAEARREVLEKDKARLEYLLSEKAVARQKVDHIIAEYQAAEQTKTLADEKVIAASAKVTQLEIVERDHRIYAPVSGYISKRFQDPGTLSASRPLFCITGEEEVKIIAAVTEIIFPKITKDMKVDIKVAAWPEEVFEGKISIISPSINPTTRTGDIEIHLENSGRKLRPGMYAELVLYLGEKNALVVPGDALVKLPGTGSRFVYTVENGRAVQKNIKAGTRQGLYTEIIEGLSEGDKVIVQGQNRINDGSVVLISSNEATGTQEKI